MTAPAEPSAAAEPSAPVEPSPISDGPPYPGTSAILDGSEAIASVETRISEIA